MRKSLLLLLPLIVTAPVGAAMNFNGSTEKASSTTVEVTAHPLTMACWVRPERDTSAEIPFGLAEPNGLSGRNMWLIQISGNLTGDPFRAVHGDNTGSSAIETTTGFTPNTWYHLAGTFTAAGFTAFINGGNKGTFVDARNNPINLSSTSIAYWRTGSTDAQFFDGSVAECGLWSVELDDAEISALSKGFAPSCVHRSALKAYYPMLRDATMLNDWFSDTANNLTLTGGAIADHPRMFTCR